MSKEFFQINQIKRLANLKSNAKVHLIGTSGVAMAPLAIALSKAGFQVSGSDKEFYEPMGSLLKNSQVKLFKGYNSSNIEAGVDLVVIGNAVSYGNPEVDFVEQKKIAYTCFPAALADLIVEKHQPIVVCGTHGKSSTTCMISSMLNNMGLDPSFFIGGLPLEFPLGLKQTNSQYSVIEGDEYDSAFFAKFPKFHFYNPYLSIITSIEYDHADIYPNLEAIITQFDQLVAKTKAFVICYGDDPVVSGQLDFWKKNTKAKIVTYGYNSNNDYKIVNFKQNGFEQVVSVSAPAGNFEIKATVIGQHNALNLLSAVACAEQLGLDRNQAIVAISKYQGLKRRQELKFSNENLVIIEDFAHHPTAVRETIAAVKAAFPQHKLWAIFEPRSNSSRRKVFQQDYIQAFKQANHVVLCEVSKASIDTNLELLDVCELAKEINKITGDAISLLDAQAIKSNLLARIEKSKDKNLFLIMSNGSFGGLIEILLSQINEAK